MNTPPIVPVVTGPYGLVGRGLLREYPQLIPIDIAPLPASFSARRDFVLPPVDITDARQIESALQAVAAAFPGQSIVLFHLAALTDTSGDKVELFEKINVEGTRNVLSACRSVGARMVHISTDYVFEGESRTGSYTELDRPTVSPKTAYAVSKYRAENLVLDDSSANEWAVARIAFPYGFPGPRAGLAEKYLAKLAELRQSKQPMRLFDDQNICPSYIPDVACGLKRIAERILVEGSPQPRVFHLVGEATTPLEFGKAIQRLFDFGDVTIESSSVQGTRYAANLALATVETQQALGWHPMPHDEALRRLKRELDVKR